MSSTYTSTRRYEFRIHGRSERFRHWERRQDRRRGRQPVYQPAPGQQPEFGRISDPENLLRAYDELRSDGGAAPGIDRLTYGDFSRAEIAAALRTVSRSLAVLRYRPYPTRSVLIPKSNGRHRELRLATIVDRTVAKALQEAITPLIDPIFLPGVYGFRPGRSTWDMLLAIEKMTLEQDRWVLAVDDVRDAFPSVRTTDVMEDYRHHISDNQVLWLLEAVLRGHEGQARTVGIDQGCAVCPESLNLRLHHALDLPQSAHDADAAGPGTPPWFRWADNLTYLCQKVSEGSQALQQARQLLQPAGLALKGEDGPPVNLKRQGASVQILGFRVSCRNGRLWYGTGEKTWKGLERDLEQAHAADNPVGAAKAAIRGWIAAYGPAFESADDDSVLRRTRGTAARYGFRELGTEAEAIGWFQEARQRWSAARRNALGDGGRS
jgi:RNA-directed DNA polymerase